MSFSKYTGVGGGTSGITIYPNLAAFPAVANNGEQGVAADTDTIYIYNSTIPGWTAVATPPVGVFISSLTTDVTATGPGAAVATISNSAVTNAKMANMANNTVKANKSGGAAAPSDLALSDVAETVSSVLTITNGSKTVVSPSNLTIQVKQSSAAQDGYLSSTDWTTFNNKQPAGTYVTSVGATAPVASSGGTTPTISIPVATALADGYLSSADFTTFNNAATTVSNATALSTPSTLMSRDVNGETALDGLSLDGSTSGAIKLQAAATTTPYTVKMPSAQGAATTFLQNDGSGNLSWTAAATLPSQTGNQDKVLATNGSAVSWQYAGLGDGTLGTNNIILGRARPTSFTTANANIIINTSTTNTITSALNNVVIGTGAGNALTTGNQLVLIGAGAGSAVNTATRGVAVGYNSEVGNFGTAIGDSAKANGERVAIGLLSNAQSNYDIAIGVGATTSGGSSTAIGSLDCVSVGNCVAIGTTAKAQATGCIAIGRQAITGTGTNQVIIGTSSGRSTAGATGANNTVVGAGSFNAAGLTSAANNVIIGQGSGTAITTASQNVIIGTTAGDNITTGTQLILIGQNARGSTGTVTRAVAIGRDALVGQFSTAIGDQADASGTEATAIGLGSQCTTTFSIALGGEAKATAAETIQFGGSSANDFANSCAIGGSLLKIATVFIGTGANGKSSAYAAKIMTQRPDATANRDLSAGTLTLAGSQSTGNALGGDVIIATAPAGAPGGTTANAHVERIRAKAATEVVVNDTGVDFDFRVEGDTDANLLFVDAGTDRVGIGNNAPAVKLHTQATTAATNTVTNVLRVDSQSSGTPAAGIGVGIEMAAQTGVGNTEIGVVLEAVTNDVTSTSEDFDFVVKTMSAGATAAERLKVGSNGTVTIANGDLVLNTAGKGLSIKSGTDAKIGVTGAFPGGNPNTITVSTTAVTSNSIVLVSPVTFTGGITGAPYVSAITAGTSFVITVPDNSFTGTVRWLIVESA